MSRLEIEKNLSQLETLELIDWLPNNKAKLKVKGEPLWAPGGPLSKTFRNSILDSFIKGHDKRDTSFYLHDYLEEDLIKIRAKVDELFDFLSRSNKRAKISAENTKSYGVYFSSKEFRWNMDNFLK